MFKRLKQLFRRNKNTNSQPFVVAKKPFKLSAEGDLVAIQLICPMCQTHWADATVQLGGFLSKESIRVKEPFQASVKIEPGKPIFCPCCGYQYTEWAIQASVLAGMNRQELQSKTDHSLGDIYGKRNTTSSKAVNDSIDLEDEGEDAEPKSEAANKSTS